jgi:hypothetical protein
VTSDSKERKGERKLVRCKNILKNCTLLDQEKRFFATWVLAFVVAHSLTFDTPINSVKQAGQMNKHLQ